jgi:AcrR family transcriptional regulator
MTLRDQQRELTRRTILSAVLDLVAEGSMGELSVPLVAARSGASVATIYRYYPTKDALLSAAAEEPARRAGGALITAGEDGSAYLRKMWEDFASHLDLVRHQLASDAGREMRNQRYDTARAWFGESLAGQGVDPETAAGRRLLRLGLLLTSSIAFLDLHDRQGRSPSEAVDDVTWAVAALTEATRAPSKQKPKREQPRKTRAT